MTITTTKEKHARRRMRIRAVISGTATRPRIAIFRSNKNFSAQIIDDTEGKTLAAVTTQGMKESGRDGVLKAAHVLADAIGKKGIKTFVFDRGGYRYAGSVQFFADALREQGLTF